MKCLLLLCLLVAGATCAPTQCQLICPFIYSPVCGSDLVTYSNSCEMQSLTCLKGRSTTLLHQGPCTPMDHDSAGAPV